MGHRGDVPRSGGGAAWIAGLAGALYVGVGVWAFAAPRSFFENVATFPPYNQHFLHDIGAFIIGIGAILLLAVLQRDSLVAALGGAAIGTAVHAASHAIDRNLGGNALDPWIQGAFTLALLVPALLRWRAIRRESR